MKIIVGLGNPGAKYLFTRHNIGFMLIDAIVKENKFQNKYKSLIQKIKIAEEQVLFVKPQTFMNLSGQAVKEIMSFYKSSLENLLVIQDDKDQFFGKIKFQKSRGNGGHNGIKNIHQELSTQDYCRLKLGIAQENNKEEEALPNTPPQETADYVLSPFHSKENLTPFLEQGVKAVYCFIEKGFETAANQFNSNNKDQSS